MNDSLQSKIRPRNFVFSTTGIGIPLRDNCGSTCGFSRRQKWIQTVLEVEKRNPLVSVQFSEWPWSRRTLLRQSTLFIIIIIIDNRGLNARWCLTPLLLSLPTAIHGQLLKTVSSAKYLGLSIDSKMNYNEHISHISKKASSVRSFIHRNTRSCPQKVKAAAYTSFMRPQLEYASTVWCPHTAHNINRLKSVQRRAAWSVMNDWSRPHSQTTPSSCTTR